MLFAVPVLYLSKYCQGCDVPDRRGGTPSELRGIYNRSVEYWVELLQNFPEAADLIDAEKKMRKTMWGQFWSAHQRFFKYLCIASKVRMLE